MPASRWIRCTALIVLGTASGLTLGQAQVRKPAPPPPPPPAAGPLSAKPVETLMGPRTQRITMSEDGDHMAIVAPKGSRQVVLIDGVEGPVFDEIPLNFSWASYQNTSGPMVFSPTGGRSAYVGRRAGDYIAVVDGKEAVTLSTPVSMKGIAGSDPGGWSFWFNHDGSRLAYGATVEPAGWVMVADGVKGQVYHALDMRQTALNGKRLIYVAQTADQQWHVVVDGKPGPGFALISGLQVTPDGAHYVYVAQRAGPDPKRFLAVVDGVETAYYSVTDVELAPDGRVAYIAVRTQADPASHGGASGDLMVGGMAIPNTTTFGVTIRVGLQAPQRHVAWNPDGKRFACVQFNRPNPGVTVLVNGKAMGQTYQTANEVRWSPDGSHLFYLAVAPTGTFPVMDGQELDAYHWIKEFQWSPDGKRYAFFGANATGIWMVVDGKVQPKAYGFEDNALTFSSDSKHVAYAAQTTVANYQPVVDGQVQPVALSNFATRIQNSQYSVPLPILIYSPDGSHLAYTGRDAASKGAVWVDGAPSYGPMQSYFHPAWSPDSKHFASLISTGKDWVIMIDGKLSAPYEDIIILNIAGARFVDGHTYRFYAVKGTDIYKVTLDVGS